MRFCPQCRSPYTTDVEHCGLDGARIVDTDTDLLLGHQIERWQVVERLGAGAMAAVYLARHQVIDREAAVKVLFGEYASDKQFAERFRREAQAAAKIKHKNIVEVLDFGETAEGANFLLMERLRGHSLSEAIQLGGAMEPRRASRITRDVAEGLAAAHAQGFIHRDLKPGNIFVFGDEGKETAKILDFGVVHLSPLGAAGEEEGRLTHTGQTLGTPYYMAPEQIAGDDALTERTDLYALGVVAYEMLLGHSPFRGSLGEVLVKHVSEKPGKVPPSGGLEKLVKRLLEKDPAKRPPNAHAVVAEIDRLQLGGRVAFTPLDQTLPPVGTEVAEIITHDLDMVPEDEPATVSLTGRSAPIPAYVEDSTTAAWGPSSESGQAPEAGRHRNIPILIAGGLAVVALAGLTSVLSEPAPNGVTRPDAPAPEDALEELRTQVSAAAEARGLMMIDATSVDALRGAYQSFRDAQAAGDFDEAQRAADVLVPGFASVAIPPQVLQRKLSRVQAILEDDSAPLERGVRREMMKTLLALRGDTEGELSEAEASDLAQRLHKLEAQANATP